MASWLKEMEANEGFHMGCDRKWFARHCYYLFLAVAVTEGLYCQARDFRLNPDVLLANSGSFLSEYSASVTWETGEVIFEITS